MRWFDSIKGSYCHQRHILMQIPDYTEGLTDRILFTSPLEPNWILVYDIDRSVARAKHSLTALIDASTGRQMDPDEARCSNRLQVVQSRCPAWLRFSACVSPSCFSSSTCSTASPLPRVSFHYAQHSQVTTLMELNNFSVVSSCNSLDHLCDPQGGFALCL